MAGIGMLITVPGSYPTSAGVLTPNAAATVGPPALFGNACDTWFDFSTNVTLAGSTATAITDRSGYGLQMAGSLPYSAAAVTAKGNRGGIFNRFGATLADGFFATAAQSLGVYDWNVAFSASMAFIYGGHPSANNPGYFFGGFDRSTAFGSGWNITPGGNHVAFGETVSVQLKPYSASGADANDVLLYGTTTLVVGNTYKLHMTYDGSGTPGGIKVYLGDAAETMNTYRSTPLTSTWLTPTGNALSFFSPVAANNAFGAVMEFFTVRRVYSAADLAAAQGWLDARY